MADTTKCTQCHDHHPNHRVIGLRGIYCLDCAKIFWKQGYPVQQIHSEKLLVDPVESQISETWDQLVSLPQQLLECQKRIQQLENEIRTVSAQIQLPQRFDLAQEIVKFVQSGEKTFTQIQTFLWDKFGTTELQIMAILRRLTHRDHLLRYDLSTDSFAMIISEKGLGERVSTLAAVYPKGMKRGIDNPGEEFSQKGPESDEKDNSIAPPSNEGSCSPNSDKPFAIYPSGQNYAQFQESTGNFGGKSA